MSEKVFIEIQKKIIDEIQRQVNNSSDFKSVEEYIEFVLTEILKENESESVYTPEEEEEIKKRLRSLGYIE